MHYNIIMMSLLHSQSTLLAMCSFIRRGFCMVNNEMRHCESEYCTFFIISLHDCESRISYLRIMATFSFRSCLCLLFGIQSCLYAEGQGRIIIKYVLIGQQVNMTCHSTSSENITWRYSLDGTYIPIYTCHDKKNGRCALTNAGSSLDNDKVNVQATRRNDTSVLSLTPSDEMEYDFECIGNVLMRTFKVKPIDQSKVIPNCIVTSPSNNANGVGNMTLSCEVTSRELDVSLTLEGIGLNILDDAPRSSQSIKAKTIYFDDFNNVRNASCTVYFPNIDITRSCIYPNIIKAQYIDEGNDIIIECDDESDVAHWRFYSSDGREEDIEDRSWIREGGRSLLIRDISEQDVGKVAVCRTRGDDNHTNNGTIIFTVISKISGDINNSNSEGTAPTPSAHAPYLVLTLLFLSLWLITIAVGGVWLGCTPKRNESSTSAIASVSGNANEDSGERETSLFNVGTGVGGDPNTLNTNNSAHNTVFEPEVNNTGENNGNRQSNNESHLYFTLEKSSPSPMNSLPRASRARCEHPDANPASLNNPQSSHWQGYEKVGEPNKGATCSYDLGEYAEVGKHFQGEGPHDIGEYAEVGKHFKEKGPPDLGEYAEVGKHFQGKGPPDLGEYAEVGKQGPPDLSGRPSIRKKPGRKKVEGDDISRLYSKVNK